MIPGTEYAPIAALDPGGIRPATAQEVEAWVAIKQSADEDHGTFAPILMVGQAVVWRLDVTNPYEQRIIWRLAALDYGAGHDAGSATLRRVGVKEWRLEVTCTRFDGAAMPMELRTIWAPTLEEATESLCADAWGPK